MNKITDSHLAEYETLGYTVVRGLLDMDRHIRPLFDEYAGVLDRLVDDLVEQGRLTLRYDGLPFETRLMRVYADSGTAHSQYFDFSLPQKEIAADTPGWYGPAVFHTLRADELLDAVERFIGPEIYATPVQHIRIKPPERILSADTVDSRVVHTPLHQDNGVLLPTADETNMLTVWFPLTEASEEMGCLMVRPGSHKAGLSPHCPGWNGLGIPEATSTRRRRRPFADVTGGCPVHASADVPRVAPQQQRSRADQFRPALQPGRGVDGARSLSGVCRAEQIESFERAARSGAMAAAVARRASPFGDAGARAVQPMECGGPCLRVVRRMR